MAKIAARFAKKHAGYKGACVIDTIDKARKAMSLTAIGDVWGIGRRLDKRLRQQGIETALQFADLQLDFITERFDIHLERVWRELNGEPCVDTDSEPHGPQKTLTCSRTFGSDIYDYSQLSDAVIQYASQIALKLRNRGKYCCEIAVFIATNRFKTSTPQYSNITQRCLAEASNDTTVLCKEAKAALKAIYRPGYGFKRAGVTVSRIVGQEGIQPSLFIDQEKARRKERAILTMDAINNGMRDRDKVHLASLPGNSLKNGQHSSRLYTQRLSDIIKINCTGRKLSDSGM